jgi:DNA-binding NarL/FixJ family response regulator
MMQNDVMSDTARIRVMLVDDHLLVRVGLTGLLKRTRRCEVVAEAATGSEAIQLFQAHRPDVTLLDRWLPDIRGEEVMVRILRDDPEAHVIMLSIDEGEEDIHRALKAGASGYASKSISGKELLVAIETVLDGGTYVSEALRGRLEECQRRPGLNERELHVLQSIADGRTNKEIASDLGLSEVTIKVYVGRIFQKLGVQDRTQAVTTAISRGIVHLV